MKTAILLITLFTTTFAAVDTTPEDVEEVSYFSITRKRYANYIGFAGGLISGYGLSYRRWVNNNWGFQVNLLPLYFQRDYHDDYYSYEIDSGYYDIGHLSLGAIFIRKITDGKYSRFSFFTGANLQTQYEKYDYYYTSSGWDDQSQSFSNRLVHNIGKEVENRISIGTGFGFEWYVWRFSFNIMTGLFGAYAIEHEDYKVGPSVEGGVHLRF